MAEATMNPGGMPPQLPPAVPNGAGDGSAAALPMQTSGFPAPGAQLPEALRGVSGGLSAFRDWIDGVLKQPSVRRALIPLVILLVLANPQVPETPQEQAALLVQAML